MSAKRRIFSYVLFVIGIALLTGTVLYYLHSRRPVPEKPKKNVPGTVADLPLVQLITGQEAIDNIHRLHGKVFPLVDGFVAVYGNQNVTLWVSDAGSASAAADLVNLMGSRIADGNSPFTLLEDLDLDGFPLYALSGMGQAHYYWQSGNLVLWLAADDPIAQQALLECVEFYR